MMEISSGNNNTGMKGMYTDFVGFNQNDMIEQDQAVYHNQMLMDIQEDQAHMGMYTSQATVAQQNELVLAKAKAANATSGLIEAEQRAMDKYLSFQDKLMEDESVPWDERIRLLGEITQQSRAGDAFKTKATNGTDVARTSHGSHQSTGFDSGMNSMSMDKVADGQSNMLTGQGTGASNSYSQQNVDYNMSMGGMGMGGMGMGGMGMGGMGMGGMGMGGMGMDGMGNMNTNLNGIGTGSVQGAPPPPPPEEKPVETPLAESSQGGFELEQ